MWNSAPGSLAVVRVAQEFELWMRQREAQRRMECKIQEGETQMTKTELRTLELAVDGMRIVRKQALAENRLEKAADANEHLIQMEQQLSVERSLRQPVSGFRGQAF
jgi:hypothetical protein